MDDERFPITVSLPEWDVGAIVTALTERGERRVPNDAHDHHLRTGGTAAPGALTNGVLSRPQPGRQGTANEHHGRRADGVRGAHVPAGLETQA